MLGKFIDPPWVSIDELVRLVSEMDAPESRKALVGDLRQYVQWCRKRGIEVDDPTELMDSIKVPSRLPTPVSPADIERVLAVAIGEARWAVMLMAFAGLRVSEVAKLEYGDVRRDLGLLMVRQGKGGGDAAVPLAPALAAELPAVGAGRMFVHLVNGGQVSRRVRQAMRRAGVGGRPHDLRASFGTEAARVSNGNVWVVQRLMRHKALTSTQRYVLLHSSGADVIDQLFTSARKSEEPPVA